MTIYQYMLHKLIKPGNGQKIFRGGMTVEDLALAQPGADWIQD